MSRNLDLDLGSVHMTYHRAPLIDLYLYKPNLIRRNFFCGRTDVSTYERTSTYVRRGGQTLRPGWPAPSRPKNQNVKQF